VFPSPESLCCGFKLFYYRGPAYSIQQQQQLHQTPVCGIITSNPPGSTMQKNPPSIPMPWGFGIRKIHKSLILSCRRHGDMVDAFLPQRIPCCACGDSCPYINPHPNPRSYGPIAFECCLSAAFAPSSPSVFGSRSIPIVPYHTIARNCQCRPQPKSKTAFFFTWKFGGDATVHSLKR
jgi:hypothetical protein